MVTDTAPETHSSLETPNAEDKKAFFAQAQETAAAALNTTVQAVKDHPVAAAAAVAGTAAAVAGAAYGISQLNSSDTGKSTKSGKSKN